MSQCGKRSSVCLQGLEGTSPVCGGSGTQNAEKEKKKEEGEGREVARERKRGLASVPSRQQPPAMAPEGSCCEYMGQLVYKSVAFAM
eukprot:762378-Prymnesium_polylepis.1